VNTVCRDLPDWRLGYRLIQYYEVADIYLQRKALLNCAKGDDDLALMAELCHHALNSPENAVTHSYLRSQGDEGMGPEE
jgi:hypothetical protein